MKLKQIFSHCAQAILILSSLSLMAHAAFARDPWQIAQNIAQGQVQGLSATTYEIGSSTIIVYVDEETGVGYLSSPLLKGAVPFDVNFKKKGEFLFFGGVPTPGSHSLDCQKDHCSMDVAFLLDGQVADRQAKTYSPIQTMKDLIEHPPLRGLKSRLNDCVNDSIDGAQSVLMYRIWDPTTPAQKNLTSGVWYVRCQQPLPEEK